ncbi:MAG: serine/threonine protein kinase [Blastocatellia bacterium]|nr:serine/threonine protein kinase [Blastocatellia bacterium]
MVEISAPLLPEIPTSAPVTDPYIGRTIDTYVIEQRIGRGGMGAVYRAHHTMINKCVAIKLLTADLTTDPMAFERFRREAEAAARLKHINAVGVTDFGRTPDGMAYLAMEYVDGHSLRYILDRQKTLPPAKVVVLIKQICAAVHAAHRKGIVHRDLKPDNVMVEITDGEEIAKVLDFGIAKLKDLKTGNSMQSEAGSLIGTPQYMSPEQCDGSSLDFRSDIYSLGVMVFEMLAGRVPFAGKPAAVMVQHVSKEPPALSIFVPNLPPAVEFCVKRALSKDPNGRQTSAAEFAAEFEAAFALPASGTVPVLSAQSYETKIDNGLAPPRIEPPAESSEIAGSASLYTTKVQFAEKEAAALLNASPTPSSKPVGKTPEQRVQALPQSSEDNPPEAKPSSSRRKLPNSGKPGPGRTGSSDLRLVPTDILSEKQSWSVQSVVRYVVTGGLCGFILYVVVTFGLQQMTCSAIEQDLKTSLLTHKPSVSGLRPHVRSILAQRAVEVSDQNLHIKVDPPNQQVMISIDYISPLLTVPMRYHVEQTVHNFVLPIEEVAHAAATDLEVINISPTELESYRVEQTQRVGQTH